MWCTRLIATCMQRGKYISSNCSEYSATTSHCMLLQVTTECHTSIFTKLDNAKGLSYHNPPQEDADVSLHYQFQTGTSIIRSASHHTCRYVCWTMCTWMLSTRSGGKMRKKLVVLVLMLLHKGASQAQTNSLRPAFNSRARPHTYTLPWRFKLNIV